MRKLIVPLLLAGSAALAGCMTADPATTAAAYNACGTYGYMDRDNDGWLEADEWNAYRAGGYSQWDRNGDGRISKREFQDCWYGGGFYRTDWYNRDYWSNYWTAFDANNDGYLSNDEYWSANAWTRMDRNNNGRIDSTEWRWW
jgi:hypothetical protein